jgi:hypothetical protein
MVWGLLDYGLRQFGGFQREATTCTMCMPFKSLWTCSYADSLRCPMIIPPRDLRLHASTTTCGARRWRVLGRRSGVSGCAP